MDLRQILHSGLASRRPIAREFEFEGESVKAYFLDLPALEVRKILADADRDVCLVAATVCDEDGKLIFTREQAASLRAGPLNTLTREALAAVGALREEKDAAKKPSTKTQG